MYLLDYIATGSMRAGKGDMVMSMMYTRLAVGAIKEIVKGVCDADAPARARDLRCIGVIGSRSLPPEVSGKVGDVTEDLLDRGFHIATGGAVGTDSFCLSRLLEIGVADKATIHTAWGSYKRFPVETRADVRRFRDTGGHILWGNINGDTDYSTVRAGLLARNVRLVDACHGIVAFLYGDSSGTLFTVSRAIQLKMPIVIFAINRELPVFPSVRWKPLLCGGCWEGGLKAVYVK
jgi:predicted Rossmann fold nucleotide-binding protein DprA/Smf involved in DNA uptake